MDINAEVSTQYSLINALFDVLEKTAPGSDKKNDKEEEDNQDAMPDSTTNNDKTIISPFHCGDDVLVPNKDGRYYLGTIVELSTSNDNDSCEVGTGIAQCLVKFGDGTHSWAPLCSLKLLSAPPADDGRIMCVVCKRREGPTTSPGSANALVACDMCGRGYHAKCHTPPVDAWINGASWHCKRCVDQRYRVAAAENRAAKRSDICRYKGGQQRRQQQELTPRCDTASTTSSAASDAGNDQSESHCYCGEKSDWLAQMLMCCRCSRWFHQRCVSSLQYPLYAGDKLYIFACCTCNGGSEYLRRLELCWLELAHLALYNLTAYNAPNYFDLDNVIMPYIKDNWHALQLPDKMWLTPVKERRQHILTALTSSRKRFKCGREMKKRATIWGLRLRRPPSPPAYLAALQQIPKGEPLTDSIVREYAPRLRFLPRHTRRDNYNGFQPSSSYCDKSSYKKQNDNMIVPVDGHWLNLMMGKRFHENLNSNSNSENDSTSCYESTKCNEVDDRRSSPTVSTTNGREPSTKDEIVESEQQLEAEEDQDSCTATIEAGISPSLLQCSESLNNISQVNDITQPTTPTQETKTQPSKLMNLEASKLSTNNIIEHSKIMSLQNVEELTSTRSSFNINDVDSSGDETSSRGTLDTIIPPLKNFQGKNNPFLMKNSTYSSKLHKENRRNHYHSRVSLPAQLNPTTGGSVRPKKRKLSEKDIVIGPNGEVKRRKHRRPKYMQLQLNNSCPLPELSPKTEQNQDWHRNNDAIPRTLHINNKAIHGRRLRQRQEKNYFENTRRNNQTATINSVQSLQLSPHKVNNAATETSAQSLSALKSSIQSYFRAGQTYNVLARRLSPNSQPAYLIQWEAASAT